MRVVFRKICFLVIYLFLGLGVVFTGLGNVSTPPPPGEPVSDGDPEAPPPGGCCVDYEDNMEVYLECERMEAAKPGSFCNPVIPIDNSVYIYSFMAAGFVLASFVIIKKIKHKKSPI